MELNYVCMWVCVYLYVFHSPDGRTSMQFEVQDTITTWDVSAFGISLSQGIGISNRVEVITKSPLSIPSLRKLHFFNF